MKATCNSKQEPRGLQKNITKFYNNPRNIILPLPQWKPPLKKYSSIFKTLSSIFKRLKLEKAKMIKKRNGCNEIRITKEVLTDSLLSPRGIVGVRILRSRSRSQGDEAVVNGGEGLEDGSTIDWWSDDGLRGGFQGTASSRKRLDDSRASAWLGLPRVCLTQFLSLVQPTQLPPAGGGCFHVGGARNVVVCTGLKGTRVRGWLRRRAEL